MYLFFYKQAFSLQNLKNNNFISLEAKVLTNSYARATRIIMFFVFLAEIRRPSPFYY